MERAVLCVLALVLVACGGSSKPAGSANREGYVLTCAEQSECEHRAGETCARGYDVIDSATAPSESSEKPAEHRLVIACK